MKPTILLLFTVSALCAFSQSPAKRVVHNNPANYRSLKAVHAGAGEMKFTGLIGSQAMATNFLYLHAGEIPDKAGIGQHFHHTIEEMYVILDGEAEFTINGHTSKIKGPAVVPCKMGDAHAIFNSSGKTIRWLNFAVSTIKGRGDNFDLNDPRVGVVPDPIPQFVSSQLKKETLRLNSSAYTGKGILYRRVFGSDIFTTTWDHVDHVIIPGGTTAQRASNGMEEVYYVLNGSGTMSFDMNSYDINADHAFFSSANDTLHIANSGGKDLELLVIGIAASAQSNAGGVNTAPRAIVLQMDFIVPKENAERFEKMYRSIYVPAMMVQQGYLGSKLLRIYPDNAAKEIEGEPTAFNYQLQISFDSEQNRRKWVASEQHKIAWPAASGLAKEFKWRGYDVIGDDKSMSQ